MMAQDTGATDIYPSHPSKYTLIKQSIIMCKVQRKFITVILILQLKSHNKSLQSCLIFCLMSACSYNQEIRVFQMIPPLQFVSQID